MSHLNKENLIDIDVFSDEIYDIEASMNRSKTTIEQLVNENRWVKGDFDDDYWVVNRLDYKELTWRFDFHKLNFFVFNSSLPKEFKHIVKCWTVHLLESYQTIAAPSLKYLIKCFEITKGFKSEEKINFIKNIEYSEYSISYKIQIINTLCNFFDYSDLEVADEYLPMLIELKDKMPFERLVRQLPPSRYVLSFSYYLEKHFDKLLTETMNSKTHKEANELFLVYPLIIWWRLSNIVPIRPSEFCLIERHCIFIENNKHYIKLPRRKQKNTKKVQMLDKILISEELYQLIISYVHLTERFGNSDVLISYRSIDAADISHNREIMTNDINVFNINVLRNLITRFYKIMRTEYNCEIPNNYRIAPNDTRHLAFVSLMMQGYSPVEIARLGGHQTIYAQYHYSGHVEYWVDCEVFKLMNKFKNASITSNQASSIPNEIKAKVLDWNDNSFQRKMKIGFCKDIEQRCESRQCYFCSHWGITADEFLEKKEVIKSDIVKMKSNINELTSVIYNLNKQFLSHEMARRNGDLLNEIKTKTNNVQNEIYKLALICSKIDTGDDFDDKISWS